ncbi:hypothetical protein [Aerococcus viridans]|uniref:hypothetical protein n=1 Tax=Aerococcus viridans TaxID=1377 RepID=UPI002DB9279F|nr:hypothetical protein [Aerococcus viridans]MEC1386625.1 hypothetical protein [Aerococcus viridans]
MLDKWLPEDLMINITKENNLPEIPFAIKEAGNYLLRWFTPGGEIVPLWTCDTCDSFRHHELYRFKFKPSFL